MMGLLSRDTGQSISPEGFKNSNQWFKRVIELLGKIKGTNKTQKQEGVLNEWLGNADILPVVYNGLTQIDSAYKDMKKQGSFISDKDIRQAKLMNAEFATLEVKAKSLTYELGVTLANSIGKMVDSLEAVIPKIKRVIHHIEGASHSGHHISTLQAALNEC